VVDIDRRTITGNCLVQCKKFQSGFETLHLMSILWFDYPVDFGAQIASLASEPTTLW